MLTGFNFLDCVEYEYEQLQTCETSGCLDEGICRCSTIENCEVTDVRFSKLVNSVYDLYFDNSKSGKRTLKINYVLGDITKDIELYTIDRILRINKVYSSNSWEIQVCNGYYGQEISCIILNHNLSTKIESELKLALNIINLTKRIEYLLTLEYGKVLPELQNCNYLLSNIEKDSIIFGSKPHFDRVKEKKLIFYSDENYKLVRGIVIEKEDGYRLIDGYHRCFASENRYISVLKAYK